MFSVKEITSRPNKPAKSTKIRVFVHLENETILDNFWNRRNRPYNLFKKDVIPHVLSKFNIPQDTKIVWRQTAGCSCGCSPGFIVDCYSAMHANIYVTVDVNTN